MIAFHRIEGRLRRPGLLRAFALALLAIAAGATPADAERIVAVYDAYWAGLPAGRIRIDLRSEGGQYRDGIEIRTEGLPRLVIGFRARASAEGRLDTDRTARPRRYDAVYDLRKRRDKRISMRFQQRDGADIAMRGPSDSSSKPPLGAAYRRNAVDPLTALERLREALRQAIAAGARKFSIPVYDGARRFDVLGRLSPKSRDAGPLRVALSLRPIAGFHGKTSDDGDPDDAPRPVDLVLSDDSRLIPLWIKVSVFYLPLVIHLDRLCSPAEPCPG